MAMNIGDTLLCLRDPKRRIVVVRHKTAGGEADLYEGLVDGAPAILKLFFSAGSTPTREKHYFKLVKKGPLHPAFVYPFDFVRSDDGRLGMVMPLVSGEYCEAARLSGLPECDQPSLPATVRACLNVCLAYFAVIRAGLMYVDVSSRQILVSKSGEVRIVDVGNIVSKATPEFNFRTFGYTAPELAQGKVLPNVATGRYSLGVTLFEMLCRDHPLLGRQLPRIAGLEDEDRALHQTPLFVFHPADARNRPDPEEHAAALVYWPILTTSVRKLFTRQFTVGLLCPNRRVIEIEWIDALWDMLCGWFTCRCGADVFWDPAVLTQSCWNCKAMLPRPARLRLKNKRDIILRSSTELTHYDITGGESYDFMPVGRVVAGHLGPDSLELRNLTRSNWTWRRGANASTTVPPGGKAPLYLDTTITFSPGSMATIVV